MASTSASTIAKTVAATGIKYTTPKRPLTWLITGCSSGIGLALARQVIAHGHHLIATSRNPAKTPELVREVEAAGGIWKALDIDDRDRGQDLVSELEHAGTHIDVLVNNAGFAILQAGELVTNEEARSVMETVFFGPMRLTQAAVEPMRKRRFGVVVYISSGAAMDPRPSMGLYGAAKAASDAFAKSLGKEVAPFNVRVLSVLLGAFRTTMAQATKVGSRPLNDDYRNTVAGQVMQLVSGSSTVGEGDPIKAAQAIFELAAAQGAVGEGHEAEPTLPLGRDMAVRMVETRDKIDHAMEVFGDLCNNVVIDAK